MKVKYIGKTEKFKLERPELSKAYDFSKGSAEVVAKDAKIMASTMAGSFSFPAPAEKDNTEKVTGK